MFTKERRRVGVEEVARFEPSIWIETDLAPICFKWVFVGGLDQECDPSRETILECKHKSFRNLDLEEVNEASTISSALLSP